MYSWCNISKCNFVLNKPVLSPEPWVLRRMWYNSYTEAWNMTDILGGFAKSFSWKKMYFDSSDIYTVLYDTMDILWTVQNGRNLADDIVKKHFAPGIKFQLSLFPRIP